jgi:hypothetical protein
VVVNVDVVREIGGGKYVVGLIGVVDFNFSIPFYNIIL